MNRYVVYFEKLASKIAFFAGKPIVFLCALLIILIWALVGPIFKYSDTWQLVINTGTTIITFLMVFLVQSSQNRDSKALQLKLDELIFKLRPADNVMINIEELSERELEVIAKKYRQLREKKATLQNTDLQKEPSDALRSANKKKRTRKKQQA